MLPDDELDRMIDTALASYAEPDEARHERLLAQRTMIFVRASRRPRKRWLWAMMAIPTVVVVVVLLLLPGRPEHPIAVRQTLSYSSPAMLPPTPLAPAHHLPANLNGVLRSNRNRRNPPRLARFPVQQPLSKQERLLTEFAANAPSQIVLALAESQRKSPQPIEIVSLKIAPLNQPVPSR